MSYADISTAVGIRKASIHYYFPSKEDLLVSLLERYTPSFFKLVDSILDSSESAEIKLRRYCEIFEATLSSGEQEKACLCGMLGAEVKTLNSSLTQHLAMELAPHNIRVNAVSPAVVETPIYQGFIPKEQVHSVLEN